MMRAMVNLRTLMCISKNRSRYRQWLGERVGICNLLILASQTGQGCTQIHVHTTPDPPADIVHLKDTTPLAEIQEKSRLLSSLSGSPRHPL